MASKLEEYLAAQARSDSAAHTKLTDRQINLLHHTFIDYQATSEFLEHPLVIERAEGLYYWDTDGKRYFDAIGGIFVAVLGHRHPRVPVPQDGDEDATDGVEISLAIGIPVVQTFRSFNHQGMFKKFRSCLVVDKRVMK